ncbi:MAG: hypothetical protein E7504_07085 [Ruminococcus sp.]|nr:hypothetical protein [Ruminococcus sp.]
MLIRNLMAAILTFGVGSALLASSEDLHPVQEGCILYHSYSSYEAMDSKLKLHDFSTGTQRTITNDHFVHAMNGDFGSHCFDVVFMAIDPDADEWDIFRYHALTGEIINLTEHSGFRNEDPKFSPDGMHLVFKRGRWEGDSFVYDLAEMDLRSGVITMLTNDAKEESMPCYAADGSCIYYAQSDQGKTAICAYSTADGSSRVLYEEEGIHAYYPLASENGLYFTRWYSTEFRNDSIACLKDGKPVMLPFCDAQSDNSDPYPLQDGSLFFSSTRAGNYDLYFYDRTSVHPMETLNTEQHELGTAYYSIADAEKIVASTADYLLARQTDSMNMDVNEDGVVNAFDLTILKKMKQGLRK